MFIQDISIITNLVLSAVFEIVECSEVCLTELRLYLLGVCSWEECDSITCNQNLNAAIPILLCLESEEVGDK